MVLSKSELIGSLEHEVRILQHLAGKVDRAKLDYRPTPKQRSTLETTNSARWRNHLVWSLCRESSRTVQLDAVL